MTNATNAPTVSQLRASFAALRAYSGLTSADFLAACETVIHEIEDGEGEGRDKWTPALWMRAALTVAHDETSRCGRDKPAAARFHAFRVTLAA